MLLFFYTIDITEQKLQEQLLKRIAKLDYDSITEVDVLQGTHRPVSIDGGGRNILLRKEVSRRSCTGLPMPI